MTQVYVSKGLFPRSYFEETVSYIARVQEPDGGIPWFPGGTLDPWDHVEAAMGLSLGGRVEAAEKAYSWLQNNQRPDGSWLAAYQRGQVVDGTRAETNFVAYVATGVWHHYQITRNQAFLRETWEMVFRAMTFVLNLQTSHGEIYWALDTRTGINRDALITGCSSIFKSLECMANIAHTLGEDPEPWLEAREKLGQAILTRPDRFDRTWESKERFSMDWFYPVLAGVMQGEVAEQRLQQRWSTFVVPELGCRCVSDESWVTIAETCELTMACIGAGNSHQAVEVFSWLHEYRHSDGSWWTGYAFEDKVLWPDERPTWTAGAVLLAADALAQHSPASYLFTQELLPDALQNTQSLRLGPFGKQS